MPVAIHLILNQSGIVRYTDVAMGQAPDLLAFGVGLVALGLATTALDFVSLLRSRVTFSSLDATTRRRQVTEGRHLSAPISSVRYEL
jgi:hypothetical protein